MKKIAIYPGNFQPPAKSHYGVYKKLKTLIGSGDVFVATTDREPIPDAPLNFGDKEQIWVRHGVPASHIVKITSLPTDSVESADSWKPEEIFSRFSSEHTVVVVALNEKEVSFFSKRQGVSNNKSDGMSAGNMSNKTKSELKEIYEELSKSNGDEEKSEDGHKSTWLKANGELQYFQPYRGNEHALKPFKEHAYVVVVTDSKIEGNSVSTTNIRGVLGSSKYNDNQKKKFFGWVFGWFDVGMYQLMTDKFKNAHQVTNSDEVPPMSPPLAAVKQKTVEPNKNLQEIVFKILKEMVDEDYSFPTNDSSGESNLTSMSDTLGNEKTPSQQKAEISKQRTDLVKQKKELEAKAKQNKEQAANYKTTAKNYDTFQKKTDRDAITTVNKQLSTSITPDSIM